MNSTLDTLYLRRPRLEYVSPAICEALFSSSSEPTIVLSDIERFSGPTGLVRGDTGNNRYFTWNVVPGVICYNVYRTPSPLDPNGIYSVVNECIPEGNIFVCSAGTFYITVVTNEGESAPGPSFVCDGENPVIAPLPQLPNTICYNLYKNATLYWSCFTGMAFEVCEPGCYKVSGIAPDGETGLSDGICFECIDQLPCVPGQIWSWDLCQCIVCPEEECEVGFHWDADTCSCVEDPPVGPCTAFIDIMPTNTYIAHVTRNGVACGENQSTQQVVLFKERVLTNLFSNASSMAYPNWVNPSGDVVGGGYNFASYGWFKPYGYSITTFGGGSGAPKFQGEPMGLSDAGVTAYNELDIALSNYNLHVRGPSGEIYDSGFGTDYLVPRYGVSPLGHVYFTDYDNDNGYGTDKVRLPNGSFASLLTPSYLTGGVGSFNNAGHLAFTGNDNNDGRNSLYFWNGTTTVLAVATGDYGIGMGNSTYGDCALNDSDMVVGFHSVSNIGQLNKPGIPFRWSPGGGFVNLGLPPGASKVSEIFIENQGLIVCVSDAGVFYNWLDTWGPIADVLPYVAAGWNSIYRILRMSTDGYVHGYGEHSTQGFAHFVGKVCPPV